MRERLDKVSARVEQAHTKLAEHPAHARLQRRLAAAEADLAETWALYDSTPGGQDDLRTAIEATTDPDGRSALTERLAAAQQLRARANRSPARGTNADNDHEEGNRHDERQTR